MEWVVYAQPPFGGPKQVLKYVARYTHRVAISNQRLLSLQDGKVTFRWKDYSRENKARNMTLDALEFILRFLLHILPGGFMQIRYFGFLSNRCRQEKIVRCKKLPAERQEPKARVPSSCCESVVDWQDQNPSGRCPLCQIGRMRRAEVFPPQEAVISGPRCHRFNPQSIAA